MSRLRNAALVLVLGSSSLVEKARAGQPAVPPKPPTTALRGSIAIDARTRELAAIVGDNLAPVKNALLMGMSGVTPEQLGNLYSGLYGPAARPEGQAVAEKGQVLFRDAISLAATGTGTASEAQLTQLRRDTDALRAVSRHPVVLPVKAQAPLTPAALILLKLVTAEGTKIGNGKTSVFEAVVSGKTNDLLLQTEADFLRRGAAAMGKRLAPGDEAALAPALAPAAVDEVKAKRQQIAVIVDLLAGGTDHAPDAMNRIGRNDLVEIQTQIRGVEAARNLLGGARRSPSPKAVVSMT